MSKSFYLIYLMMFCSLQSFFTVQAQPPLDPTTSGFVESTPEEIQVALSENFGNIINAFGEYFLAVANPTSLANLGFSADAGFEPDFLQLVEDQYEGIGYLYVNNAQTIGDAYATVITDGLVAFKDAQERREDVGAAVGNVLADALRDLNNNAEIIGDVIQEEFDAVLDFASEESEFSFAYANIGDGVEKIINALSDRADAIGDGVAQVVNEAVSQGGSTAQQLGNALAGLITAIQNNPQGLNDFIDEVYADYPIEQRDLIKNQIASGLLTFSEFDAQTITFLIESLMRDTHSTVEAIDMFGDLMVQTVEEMKMAV